MAKTVYITIANFSKWKMDDVEIILRDYFMF